MNKNYNDNLIWETVEWPLVIDRVRKLQRRIYKTKASRSKHRVYGLQKLLINSLDAKLLAVRMVTTLNEGNQIAGSTCDTSTSIFTTLPDQLKRSVVEKQVIVSHRDKMKMARNLTLNGKACPISPALVGNTIEKASTRLFSENVDWTTSGKTFSCTRVPSFTRPAFRTRETAVKETFRKRGIPIIQDRAKQALAKLALEPEWEATFEPNSYGSRPGRSPHDAIEAIFLALSHNTPKWAFRADTKKSFNRINNSYFLKKLETFPQMEDQINAWLKAGVLERYANTPKIEFSRIEHFMSGSSSTVDEGDISPLLSNIALHGLELYLKEYIGNLSYKIFPTPLIGKRTRKKSLSVVRYGSDFVVIHAQKEILGLCIDETHKWLSNIGLKVSHEIPPKGFPSENLVLPKGELRVAPATPDSPLSGVGYPNTFFKRTPIESASKDEKSVIKDCRDNFHFLGFTISLVRKNKEDYRVRIIPSRESQLAFINKAGTIIKNSRSVSTYHLINMLRPVVIGWANYFKFCECSNIFTKQSYLLYQIIRHWVFRRHPQEARTLVKERYWPSGRTYYYDGSKHQDNWVLCGKTLKENVSVENYLPQMSWVHSRKFVKIQGEKSPFDSDNDYWATRNSRYSGYSFRVSKLYKVQGGVCTICKRHFDAFSKLEVDHIIPKDLGGKDTYSNLQLLHESCHMKKIDHDMILIRKAKKEQSL